MDFTALAQELGVTDREAAGRHAEEPPAGGQPPGGSPTDMAANLAKELGLSESKVKAALART